MFERILKDLANRHFEVMWRYENMTNSIMERLIFDSEEMEKIRDILIDSDAVRCESVSPETPFPGVNSYLLFSSTHRVIVDFNKMAKAIYNAGYRKGEK